jgi:hypothetical protein
MRYLPSFLLLAALLWLASCAAPNTQTLLKKSPHDPDISSAVRKLDGKKKKPKHVKRLETAFRAAQHADLLATDSLLGLAASDRWLYVNALHRRIQSRQEKIAPLLPLRADDGYRPDLLLVADIADREAASRRAAAAHLYDRAQALLAETERTGRKQPARDAYHMLRNLKSNYFSYWENANALTDSAYRAGQAHILLETDLRAITWGELSFWKNAGPLAAQQFNTEWLLFYQNPTDRPHFDFVVKSRLADLYIGPESRWETSRTESKQIEVGCKEVRDTSGKVVERTPIYETVTATVTEVRVTKNATAALLVEVLHGRTDQVLHNEYLSDSQHFDETWVSVSGDSRALTFTPISTNIGCPSAPSDWAMEDRLANSLRWSLGRLCRRLLPGM